LDLLNATHAYHIGLTYIIDTTDTKVGALITDDLIDHTVVFNVLVSADLRGTEIEFEAFLAVVGFFSTVVDSGWITVDFRSVDGDHERTFLVIG
jgi:hypothetical protein